MLVIGFLWLGRGCFFGRGRVARARGVVRRRVVCLAGGRGVGGGGCLFGL